MTFDPSDPRITAYVFGELSAEESVTFEQEMDELAELREAVESTRNVTEQLASELVGEGTPQLSDDRHAQVVQAQVEQANTEKSAVPPIVVGTSRWGWKTAVSFLTLTAAACLLIVTFVQHNKTSRTSGLADANSEDTTASAGKVEMTDSSAVEEDSEMPESDESTLVNKRVMSLSRGPRPTAEGSPVVSGLATPPLTTPQPIPAGGNAMYGRDSAIKAALGSVARESRDGPFGLPNNANGQGEGEGPGMRGDQFDFIFENRFHRPLTSGKSTFSIDVDTASYAKVRMYLMQANSMPRPDAVRIEELVNYFAYAYDPPKDDTPFSSHLSVSDCPWQPTHRLVRVALQGRAIDDDRPASNLVFLIDVSGSMKSANKLSLLKAAMKMLAEQLGENDQVSMVVYAGAAGVVLPTTNGAETHEIVAALERLSAGGSTNGGQGIELAYQMALDSFIPGGVNRVLLCTDGDFNVGTTGTDQLVRLAAERAKNGVQLTVLGFGMGNHNDAMLEQISNRGNGNYAFIDTLNEARKVLVEQMHGTLVTIAKDVKIQVVFNPSTVTAYRLIGYENRVMRTEDFDDDNKDAGEIGAGHRVTALYEVIPTGAESPILSKLPEVDELKYQTRTATGTSDDLLTVYVRYKDPEAEKSKKLTFELHDEGQRFGDMDIDFRFASSVASFGMLLRGSEYAGDSSYDAVLEIASEASGPDKHGYRSEFLQMVEKAKELSDGQ